ncbi:hypothetical protein CR513_11324, partial [Mucuna pruriens]
MGRSFEDPSCPTEARPYRSHEKKLDSRTVSCYFVGYIECSWGYKFYDPTSRSFFKTGNTRILEEVEFEKEENIRNVVFDKEFVNEIGQRFIKERRHAIANDYIVFLQEHEDDISLTEDDPINFSQAMQSSNSQKWIDAMKDELKSIQDNDVWDLVKLPEGVKPIGCKWIFKTKNDSKKEDIGYKETFSSVYSKDSFRTVMALVAHFDLELHQMDVKTAFLNDETIYMVQPKSFVSNKFKSMVCKLKKSIYGLKQASCQWYHKFHQIITLYGFEVNVVNDCVYHKFSGSKYIFLVLYVDDILLASSDIGLLHETKTFLTKNFEMKDLGEVSFILGIQILRYRS